MLYTCKVSIECKMYISLVVSKFYISFFCFNLRYSYKFESLEKLLVFVSLMHNFTSTMKVATIKVKNYCADMEKTLLAVNVNTIRRGQRQVPIKKRKIDYGKEESSLLS